MSDADFANLLLSGLLAAVFTPGAHFAVMAFFALLKGKE